MQQEKVTIREHRPLCGDYRLLVMEAPGVGPQVQPGQFIHFDVPNQPERMLRRPFSVYKADSETVSILYKPVGRGTRAMVNIQPGDTSSIIGPLGHGFPLPDTPCPVLVAGGYGMAALFLVAKNMPRKGTIFMGGRSSKDILCVDEFKAIDWDVVITTNDGSLGTQGLVTDALDQWCKDRGYLNKKSEIKPEFFACGPNPMLKAVSDRALANNWTAWLSMDRNMGCGIGACLVCVQKVKRDQPGPNGEDWKWSRVCREGPVFECRQLVWDADE
jgi:dihydroorotate dehydrogenase electron transfer subunit